MKFLLLKMPEYYLVVLAILAVYKQPLVATLVLMGIVAVLVAQIIYQNKISGFIIAGIFLFVNFYMLGALISEFNEFSEVNAAAIKLLSVGLLIITINLITAGIMIYKYGFKKYWLKYGYCWPYAPITRRTNNCARTIILFICFSFVPLIIRN